MIMHNCKAPGCFVVVAERGTYCKKHSKGASEDAARKAQARAKGPWAGAARPNEALYHTSEWRALRADALRRCPRCVRCGEKERLQVHHLTPPKGDPVLFYDPDNLAVLCFDCHTRLTRAENCGK